MVEMATTEAFRSQAFKPQGVAASYRAGAVFSNKINMKYTLAVIGHFVNQGHSEQEENFEKLCARHAKKEVKNFESGLVRIIDADTTLFSKHSAIRLLAELNPRKTLNTIISCMKRGSIPAPFAFSEIDALAIINKELRKPIFEYLCHQISNGAPPDIKEEARLSKELLAQNGARAANEFPFVVPKAHEQPPAKAPMLESPML